MNKLKQHRLDQKNASAAAAEDTQFTVGSEPQSVEPTPIAASAAPVPAVVDVDSPTTEESSSESESVERVDWQLGASGTGLDYDALSAMPPEYRTKYISECNPCHANQRSC